MVFVAGCNVDVSQSSRASYCRVKVERNGNVVNPVCCVVGWVSPGIGLVFMLGKGGRENEFLVYQEGME